jgi:hypothetical protein
MRESQQIAAEHQNLAAHAHLTGAVQHGQEDHLTGHERSRQALEHSNQAYLHLPQEHQEAGTGEGIDVIAPKANEQEIAAIAYEFWQARRGPEGSPDEDWFRAIEELKLRGKGDHK